MNTKMSRIKAALCMVGAVLAAAGSAWAQPANPSVVIAQVYGSGGNAGAVYTRDFVVLFNRTPAPVNIDGWSLQYGGSTGPVGPNVAQIQALAGNIPAYSYILVAGASGNNANTTPIGAAIPQIDINNTPAAANQIFPGINLSGSNGKIALVNSVTGLNVSNPLSPLAPTLIDFVGYGSANASEGAAPAPALSAPNALFRASNGCVDTNANASDFAALAAGVPFSSASPANVCTGVTPPSGVSSTAAAEACPTIDVTFSVTITPSTGSNNGITSVVADFTSVGGSTGVALLNGGSGNLYSAVQTINLDPTGVTQTGNKSIPVVITDASGRIGNASIGILVPNCTLGLTTGTTLAFGAVCNGETQRLTVVARPARIPAASGPSTGLSATADLTVFGGGSAVSLGTPTGPDANGNFTFVLDFPASITPPFPSGPFPVSVTLSDAQARTATQNTNATFSMLSGCSSSTSTVVFSQIYGGGGNTGAQFNADYVELFNRSASPVDIGGWSVQYFTATNGASGKFDIPANTTIPAGRYLLISLTLAPGTVGAPISADLTVASTIFASSGDGRFVLVRNAAVIPTTCPSGNPDVADLVAYGSPTCFEGQGAARGLSNTTAIFRLNNGCSDRDQNIADFGIAAPAPRNASTPVNNCGTPNTAPTLAAGTAAPVSACPAENVSFSVTVTPGNSAITAVTANLAPIGGSASAALTAGSGGSFSITTSVGAVATGAKTIIVTATDANGLTGTFNISFTVTTCTPSSVICCRGVTCTSVLSANDCTAPAGVGIRVLDPVITSCNGQSAVNSGCCYADFNKSGVKDVADIFAFLSAWFANSPFADVGGDGTGTRDVSDIFQFLSAWFVGCA